MDQGPGHGPGWYTLPIRPSEPYTWAGLMTDTRAMNSGTKVRDPKDAIALSSDPWTQEEFTLLGKFHGLHGLGL